MKSDYRSFVLENIDTLQPMDTPQQKLLFAVVGLAGECGELDEAIEEHSLGWINSEGVVSEMGDVLFYLIAVAEALGRNLVTCGYPTCESFSRLACYLMENVKKSIYHGKDTDGRVYFRMVEIYTALERLTASHNITMEDIQNQNMQKLNDRKQNQLRAFMEGDTNDQD
jgi:NTP pyrophosphatase (non-canonical NTP hydrolase)